MLLIVDGIAVGLICGLVACCRRSSWASTAPSPYSQDEERDNNTFGVRGKIARAVQRKVVDMTTVVLTKPLHPEDAVRQEDALRFNDCGHAISGGVRDSARIAIERFGIRKNMPLWELNPATQSTAQQRYHLHFAPSDLKQRIQADPPSSDCLMVAVDVDYYLFDPSFLLQHGRPVVLFTFSPKKVSGQDGECNFTIIDNFVHYEVDGGGKWRHKLWDWCESGEFVETERTLSGWRRLLQWSGWLIGLRPFVTHKIVSHRPWEQCPDRALLLCLPETQDRKSVV